MTRSTLFVLLATLVVGGLFLAVDPLGWMPETDDGVGIDPSLDEVIAGAAREVEEAPGLAPAPGVVTSSGRLDPEYERDYGLGPVVVFGRVESAAGGALGGARVSIDADDVAVSDLGVRTRPDGAYRLRGLPEGVSTVIAAHPAHRARSIVTDALTAGAEVELETLVLEQRRDERTDVQILVTDFAGNAIPGAKVLLTTMSWDLHLAGGPEMSGIPGVRHKAAVTDGDGRALLSNVVPDEYQLVVTATGFATESRIGVLVSAGTTRRVTFRLDSAVTIEGRLVDHEGRGVSGVAMAMRMPTWASSVVALSASDGSFTIDGLLPGQHMVIGVSDEHGQTMAPFQAPGRGLTLKLAGAGVVKGRVLDESGEPVTAGNVRPFQATYYSYPYSQVHALGTDGTFSVPLPKGDWIFRVETPDGRVSADTPAVVALDETTEIEIRMPPVFVVRGVVVDGAGSHVEGAAVYVMQGGFPPTPSREFWARTDEDGSFEIAGLPEGATGLHVEHPAYSKGTFDAVATPRGSATTVRVVVLPGATLEGLVRDATGAPVAGQQVTAQLGGQFLTPRSTWSGPDGRYRLTPLDAGEWTIGAGPLGAPVASRKVTLAGGTTVTVDLDLPATTGVLTGLVLVGGLPAVGAEVVVSDARGIGSGKAIADAEGRFRVEGLALGAVRVQAIAANGARADASATLAADAPSEVTIEIGTATLRARIVDPDGNAVSGVFANLESPDTSQGGEMRWRPLPQTGADGVIQATGVPPGRWRLRASQGSFAAIVTAPFEIRETATVDLGTIAMRRAAEIRGRVTDDTGAVIGHATAAVKRPNGEPVFLFSTATTGSDGRFVLREIEPGPYRLRVEALGHAPYEAPVDVPEGGVDTTAVLVRGGGILFDVRDLDGEPIGGARLVLFDAEGRAVLRTLSLVNFNDTGVRHTAPDGSALIDDLAAGGYRVVAEHDGYEMDGAPVPVSVQPGSRSAARIVLRPKSP